MGAPKLKWTTEEEAALKAGIAKYGTGKWSTILKDTEFSGVLHSRSNVDLKDKWRNMNVAANGLGSRSKPRVPVRNNQQIVKDDRNPMALSTIVLGDQVIIDATPLAISDGTVENGTVEDGSPKKPMSRLDDLIFEAITNLKEPRGSSRATIAMYIEERYSSPDNLETLVARCLKRLTEDGKLIKVKHLYRILPPSAGNINKESGPLLLEGIRKNSSPIIEKNTDQMLTKWEVEEFLENMKDMDPHQAALVAAQAIAEAEAAIALAEEAAREAEQAEAELEEANAYAQAAWNTFMKTNVH